MGDGSFLTAGVGAVVAQEASNAANSGTIRGRGICFMRVEAVRAMEERT